MKELPMNRTLVALTKCDLPPGGDRVLPDGLTRVRLSAVTGEGLPALRAAISAKLGLAHESSGQPVVALRHAAELRRAAQQARLAGDALADGAERLVIAANHLREATEALGRIVGRVYSDDLLATIFGRFCVGK